MDFRVGVRCGVFMKVLGKGVKIILGMGLWDREWDIPFMLALRVGNDRPLHRVGFSLEDFFIW